MNFKKRQQKAGGPSHPYSKFQALFSLLSLQTSYRNFDAKQTNKKTSVPLQMKTTTAKQTLPAKKDSHTGNTLIFSFYGRSTAHIVQYPTKPRQHEHI